MKYTKVILCGLRCTGKTTLMWNLQKKLGWPMFSVSQFLRDYIRTYHVSPFEVEDQSEKITADIDSRVEALVHGENAVIIESRVTHLMSRSVEGTLKILLTASDDIRVRRSSKREQTDLKKAKKRLFKRERTFTERMEKIYKVDNLFDKKHYDLVIQTDDLTPEGVMKLVLNAIEA